MDPEFKQKYFDQRENDEEWHATQCAEFMQYKRAQGLENDIFEIDSNISDHFIFDQDIQIDP